MSKKSISALSSESFNSSRAWKSKRLSRVDIQLEDDAQCQLEKQNEEEPTDFQKSWGRDFKETVRWQQNELVAASTLVALFLSVYDLIIDYTTSGLSLGNNVEIQAAIIVHWVISLMCFLYCAFVATLFFSRATRIQDFCMRKYTILCSSSIVSIHLILVYSHVMIEMRKIFFPVDLHDYVHPMIIFPGTALPVRACNNTQPWRAWLQTDETFPLGGSGCNVALLSGGSYCTYLLIVLLPLIVELHFLPAIAISAANSAVLIAAALAVGADGGGTIVAIFFQAGAGAAVAAGCCMRTAARQRQFALARAMRNTSDRNRSLLHTLVPPNVVDYLDSLSLSSGRDSFSGGGELVGRDIPLCTVMFCTLERHAELQEAFSEEAFDLLSDIFAAFDDAVRRFGMYKYQHVGEWCGPFSPWALKRVLSASARRLRPLTQHFFGI